MPTYILQDPGGAEYRLSTLSEDLAQQWFDEWLPRLYGGLPESYGLPLLTVWPLQSADGSSLDWAADNRYIGKPFKIPRDPEQALAAVAKQRAWINEQIRKAHAYGT